MSEYEIVCVLGQSFEKVKDMDKGEHGHTFFLFLFFTNYNKLYVRPHMSFPRTDIHHTLV